MSEEMLKLAEVTQEDRKMAVAYAATRSRDLAEQAGIAEIAFGFQDSHPLVQAFARHRLAERERCAKVADEASRNNAREPSPMPSPSTHLSDQPS